MARYVRQHVSPSISGSGGIDLLTVGPDDYIGDLVTAVVDFAGADPMVVLTQGPVANADGTLVGWTATVRNDDSSAHTFYITTVSE
jgi:hypothetical protein